MLMTAIATLLTPVGARGSPYLLMAVRFVQGLGQVRNITSGLKVRPDKLPGQC